MHSRFLSSEKSTHKKAKVFDLFFNIGACVSIRVKSPNVDEWVEREQEPSDLLEYQWRNV